MDPGLYDPGFQLNPFKCVDDNLMHISDIVNRWRLVFDARLRLPKISYSLEDRHGISQMIYATVRYLVTRESKKYQLRTLTGQVT